MISVVRLANCNRLSGKVVRPSYHVITSLVRLVNFPKLCRYPLDLSRFTQSQLFSTELAQVGEDTLPWLAEVQRTLPGWQQRKTLYISSEKIVDLTIGQHLYMHGPHIFRYKDLKMVTHFPELQ